MITVLVLGLISPRVGQNDRPLPSTRMVTNIAISQVVVEEENFTAMLVGFGQFLDHDLDHVPISRSNDAFFKHSSAEGCK